MTATARGAQHDRTGLPNQDAVRVLEVDGAVAGLVAAVADGHGGSRYVRSDTGSRIAVDIAGAVGAEILAELGPAANGASVRRVVESSMVPSVVARWRDAVLADHRSRPFDAEEHARGGANLDGDPPVAYGCTLIVAMLGPTWGVLVQIGDGDALAIDAQGRTSAPVPTDARLVGGETTSLCLPDAASDARIAVLEVPLPELVVLTSDGYGNSFASPEWRREAGTGIFDAVRRDGLAAVAERLPDWLGDSAVAGGDDVTMALIMGTAGSPPPSGASVASGTTARSGERRTLRSWFALGVAALVVLAIGAGLGWFMHNSSDVTDAVTPENTTSTAPIATTPPTAAIAVEAEPAAPPRYAAVTKKGVVVTFESDETPDPQVLVGTTGLARHTAPTDPRGRRWTATSKSVSGARSKSDPVKVAFPAAVQDGDLVLVGSTLWVLSTDGSRLWSIDTTAADPTAQPAAGWPVPGP